MKIIKACMKLYDDKDDHTNGNTNCKAGNIYERIRPVPDQTSECCFKVILKHKQDVTSEEY
jgi:hypothetical protein